MEQSPILLFIAAAALLIALIAGWFALRSIRRSRNADLTEAKHLAELELLRKERVELTEKAEKAELRAQTAEKEALLKNQLAEQMQQQMADWEKNQKKTVDDAKLATTKIGEDLVKNLLEHTKREAEAQRKEQGEWFLKNTAGVMEQFQKVTQSVFALQAQTGEAKTQMEMVMRALTNPGGAGHMAEIGLENSLKNLGLEPGRDFILQYHIAGADGKSLRPDAVVFLPQDMVMVVDSKASKFLIELEGARGTEREAEIREKLKRTMQEHVRALAGKDYKSAIEQSYREAGRESRIGRVFNVMYLPTDNAMSHISESYPGFAEQLEKCEIIPTGPTGLTGLFLLARQQIAEARQLENHQQIIEVVQQLIDGVGSMLGHVESIGKGIHNTATAFQKMGGSFNRTVLPKLRRLEKLGAMSGKNKELPKPVATYEVRKSEEVILLEVEETVTTSVEVKLLEKESA